MNPRRVVTSGAPTLFTYIDLIGVPQARDGWSVFCPPEAIGGVGQGQGAGYATATRIEIRPIQLNDHESRPITYLSGCLRIFPSANHTRPPADDEEVITCTADVGALLAASAAVGLPRHECAR